MLGSSYPPFPLYGATGYVARGGRRRRTRRTRRTRRMRGGAGYVPQGGEMGTKPQWGSSPQKLSYNAGANPRGTTGGRRRRGRRTMRGGYRLSEAAGSSHGYTLLGYMPPSNSGQR